MGIDYFDRYLQGPGMNQHTAVLVALVSTKSIQDDRTTIT